MSERTALITGATSGIGYRAAEHFIADGWNVWVAGRDAQRTRQAAAQLGGRALTMDVTDTTQIGEAVAAVGELDALVNNAGIQPDFAVPLLDADAALMRIAYETNVFGVVAVTNAFVPTLRRSSVPRIVNVSSGTASFAWSTGPNPQFDWEATAANGGRFAVYRSTKAALNALTLYYAQALAGVGFKVNAVAPGARATGLNPSDRGGDPIAAAPEIVRLAGLADDGPTGGFFSYDGSVAPW